MASIINNIILFVVADMTYSIIVKVTKTFLF